MSSSRCINVQRRALVTTPCFLPLPASWRCRQSSSWQVAAATPRQQPSIRMRCLHSTRSLRQEEEDDHRSSVKSRGPLPGSINRDPFESLRSLARGDDHRRPSGGSDSASDLSHGLWDAVTTNAQRLVPINQMQYPSGSTLTNSPNSTTGHKSTPFFPPSPFFTNRLPAEPEPPKLRLSPSIGRSVNIQADKGIDLARAIGLMNGQLNNNSVRHDLNAQRFHERPGLRRKRLKSQRWRRRFAAGFGAMLRQVHHMRQQGW